MGVLDPDAIIDREHECCRCDVIVESDSDTAAHFRRDGRYFLFSCQDGPEGVLLFGGNPPRTSTPIRSIRSTM